MPSRRLDKLGQRSLGKHRRGGSFPPGRGVFNGFLSSGACFSLFVFFPAWKNLKIEIISESYYRIHFIFVALTSVHFSAVPGGTMPDCVCLKNENI